jgi:aldehyde:ferredoxin oxidoreductase
MMKIWRVDMKSKQVTKEDTPLNWQHLGGRGLIARILIDEVPGICDPLGPKNKLIFAPGLLVGHRLSSCDRISVGTKSPLTGGVKEANAGGKTGLQLTHLGIKALIIENLPGEQDFFILYLSQKSIQFLPAVELAGKGVYETTKILVDKFGTSPAIALIGPGGEMKLASAGIQNIDKDGTPSRINARGGVGAVMGAKGLKAIVIDSSEGESPPLADEKKFKQAQKEFQKALLAHPQTTVYAEYGTAAMTMMSNGFGAIPTRNFSSGQFEDAEKISGEFMRDLLMKRGGKAQTTHACMAGCIIRCSNVFADESGKAEIVSPLEYETIGLLGSNLGIGDLDWIAKLNWEINDLGLDSIEIGAALGVAAEAGLFQFGDAQAALDLIKQIRAGTPLGRLIGSGTQTTGKVLGVSRIPVVKGQAMSAYEPRVIKGTGVTYATSPQGADHTSGLTIRAKVDHQDPEGQAKLSRNAQINMAGYDTLGACIFAGFGFSSAPHTIRDLINSRYGLTVEEDILQQLGKETLQLEREFNTSAGFTKADDRLPEWMYSEPVPPINPVFDVPDEDLDTIFDW